MELRKLGRTDIEVSSLCLGSMTWGTQNTAEQGHEQLDFAVHHGINFIDTAEMYPVNPIRSETIGRTERIIGLWLEEQMDRSKIVIATKHAGKGMKHVREGAAITDKTIPLAIEGSLRRLKTDYIDLYQFHWPNRGSYMFRQNWTFDPTGHKRSDIIQNMHDCVGALQREVDRGTIRAFGLSNESAWGTSQWLDIAEKNGGPRVASVQNEYSLMCRLYDADMAELSIHEEVGLLAFSPLAGGFLTGKYQNGNVPAGSRMALSPDMGGRKTARVFDAVQAYLDVARKHGIDPVQMALSWCLTRPFMCSAIFGATCIAHIEKALGAADLKLGPDVLDDITRAHRAFPMPY